MADDGLHPGSDLWTRIWYQDREGNKAGLMELFNSITTKDLNNPVAADPDYTLLQVLIRDFDLENNYPELINSIFKLQHVDPQFVNINKTNPTNGATALMLAAARGNLELVNALIAWKANPHAVSIDLMTAFACACACEHVEVARYLSEYVTREELELEQTYYGHTVRVEVEKNLRQFPHQTKYDTLLKIICDIEIRHLVEERIATDLDTY